MIGEKIKRYRLETDMTQCELAKILEIDRTYLSQVENGKKQASRNLINKLVELTGESHNYWTQRIIEITCSNCGEIARAEARLGNNHIKLNCKCGNKKELVIVASTKIEMAYEVKEVKMNLENLSLERIENEDITGRRIIRLIKAGNSDFEIQKKIAATTGLSYEDIKWKIKELKGLGVSKKKK